MASAFVYHETKCLHKYTKRTSYGSQRPVVEFPLARGQYDPNGQATVIGDRKARVIHKLMSDLSCKFQFIINTVTWKCPKETYGACR